MSQSKRAHLDKPVSKPKPYYPRGSISSDTGLWRLPLFILFMLGGCGTLAFIGWLLNSAF